MQIYHEDFHVLSPALWKLELLYKSVIRGGRLKVPEARKKSIIREDTRLKTWKCKSLSHFSKRPSNFVKNKRITLIFYWVCGHRANSPKLSSFPSFALNFLLRPLILSSTCWAAPSSNKHSLALFSWRGFGRSYLD